MNIFSEARAIACPHKTLQDTLQHFIYGAQRLHSVLYNYITNFATNRGKRRRRKSHRIQQIEVHSQYSSSFKLKANFPRFIVNLALSCIQLLFTHRLHLPYKMSVIYQWGVAYIVVLINNSRRITKYYDIFLSLILFIQYIAIKFNETILAENFVLPFDF